MRPLIWSGVLVVFSAAFQLTVAKYGSNVPDGWIIACWLLPLIPLLYLVGTHQKLLRQRQWYTDKFNTKKTTTILGTLAVVLILSVSLGSAGYRVWVLLTRKPATQPSQTVQAPQAPQPILQPPQPVTSPTTEGKKGKNKPQSTPQPAQDNSVHIDTGSNVTQSSQGPCSPNIIGGSNSVNCNPSLLEIKWETLDVIPPALTREKHEFQYEKQVKVNVNMTYTPVSLAIVCNADIDEVDAGSVGNSGHFNPRFGVDSINKKVGFAYFEGTPVTPDNPLYISVWSKQPFSVLEVRVARFNRN